MIIFGSRGYLRVLAMVNFVCNNCHNPAAQRIVQRVTKFTLFFIPLFPIAKSYTSTCTFCGFSQKITKDLADQYASHANAPAEPVGPAREQIAAQVGPGAQPQQYAQPQHYGQAQQFGQPQYGAQPQQFGQPQPFPQPQQYGPPAAQQPQQQPPNEGQQYGDPSAPNYPR